MVYVVMKEEGWTYGEWETEVMLFDTFDKAKKFMEDDFKDFMEWKNLTLESFVEEDDADNGDWVMGDRNDSFIECYEDGNYIENHYKISIMEKEIM